jgi:hypothetical protein
MLDGEHAAQTIEIDTVEIDDVVVVDDVSLDAKLDTKPACVALVPLVQTAQWSHRRPLPLPSSIFVTQLIATGGAEPQASLSATAFDANAAYTANRHRLTGAGIRPRQTA